MSRKRIAIYAFIAVIPLIAALFIAGFDPNYELGNYVTTDNARVAGNVVDASAPSGGQVNSLPVQVGDPVDKGQVVALLKSVGSTSPTGASMLPFLPEVRAPSAGTVVHLSVVPGQAIATGQSVATIVDLSSLWIAAGIDENSFKMVHPGQKVDVYVPAVDHTFAGQVSQLMADANPGAPRTASSGSTSAAQVQSQSSGQVPIAITFSYDGFTLYPGMSASVKIYVH